MKNTSKAADRMIESDANNSILDEKLTREGRASSAESVLSAAMFYEFSKQIFLILCKLQESEQDVQTLLGTAVVKNSAKLWADVAVEYIVALKHHDVERKEHNNEVSKHFGIIMSAHFVATTINELESSLKRHHIAFAKLENAGKELSYGAASIAANVHRQEETFVPIWPTEWEKISAKSCAATILCLI